MVKLGPSSVYHFQQGTSLDQRSFPFHVISSPNVTSLIDLTPSQAPTTYCLFPITYYLSFHTRLPRCPPF